MTFSLLSYKTNRMCCRWEKRLHLKKSYWSILTRWSRCRSVTAPCCWGLNLHAGRASQVTFVGFTNRMLGAAGGGGDFVPRSISPLSLRISFEAAAGGGRPLSLQQFSPQLFTPHQVSLNSSTPSSLLTLAPFAGLNFKSYPIVVWEPLLSGMFDTGLLNYVPNFESVCHYSLGWKMLSRPPTKCRPPQSPPLPESFQTSWVKMKSRSSPSQPRQWLMKLFFFVFEIARQKEIFF